MCIAYFRLVLRIQTDLTFDHLGHFGDKFGCHYEQIRDVLLIAKELELNVMGVR